MYSRQTRAQILRLSCIYTENMVEHPDLECRRMYQKAARACGRLLLGRCNFLQTNEEMYEVWRAVWGESTRSEIYQLAFSVYNDIEKVGYMDEPVRVV